MPAKAATCASRTSGKAAPARILVSLNGTAALKFRARRITTPGTPPSRTSRFDPTPITVTGMSSGHRERK